LKVKGVSPDDFRKYSDSDSLYSILPEGVEEDEIRALTKEGGTSDFFEILGEKILSYLTADLKSALGFFSGLCTLILLSSLYESTKKSFGAKLDGAFDLLFLLVLAFFTYRYFSRSIEKVQSAVSAANTFLLSAIPILSVLMSVSGAVNSAAVQGACHSFMITGISYVSSNILLPLLRTLFCFSLLDGSQEGRMGGIVRFFQKTAKNVCIFSFLFITAALSLKNALASASDSLGMRSVRFAAGSFIPVVGSLVGESSKTLSAALKVVRTECGTTVLVVLLIVLLQPILYLVVQKCVLSLGETVSEVMGEGRCKKFLASLNKTMDFLLALLICHACYLIFAITLFIRTGGNLS
jgi:stage III sporulation protein AE